MSVTKFIPEMEPDPFGESARGLTCFHCGKFLTDPAVMWKGDFDLYLHADCVSDLFLRMFRDVVEIRYAKHPHRKLRVFP
jgi:hypothetical protein